MFIMLLNKLLLRLLSMRMMFSIIHSSSWVSDIKSEERERDGESSLAGAMYLRTDCHLATPSVREFT